LRLFLFIKGLRQTGRKKDRGFELRSEKKKRGEARGRTAAPAKHHEELIKRGSGKT